VFSIAREPGRSYRFFRSTHSRQPPSPVAGIAYSRWTTIVAGAYGDERPPRMAGGTPNRLRDTIRDTDCVAIIGVRVGSAIIKARVVIFFCYYFGDTVCPRHGYVTVTDPANKSRPPEYEPGAPCVRFRHGPTASLNGGPHLCFGALRDVVWRARKQIDTNAFLRKTIVTIIKSGARPSS